MFNTSTKKKKSLTINSVTQKANATERNLKNSAGHGGIFLYSLYLENGVQGYPWL